MNQIARTNRHCAIAVMIRKLMKMHKIPIKILAQMTLSVESVSKKLLDKQIQTMGIANGQ